MLDSQKGINVRITTLDFKVVYEGDKIRDIYSISALDPNSEHYEEIVCKINGTHQGEASYTNDDGHEFMMYWRVIPNPPDEQFYIIMMADKDLIKSESSINSFTIGMYLVGLVLIISLWDSTYVRIKNKSK